MRKPSEYIPAAMAKLRRSLIPDCSEVLRHGGRSAEVTRVGAVSKGGDSVTDSDVNENVRVLADAPVREVPAFKGTRGHQNGRHEDYGFFHVLNHWPLHVTSRI